MSYAYADDKHMKLTDVNIGNCLGTFINFNVLTYNYLVHTRTVLLTKIILFKTLILNTLWS